MQEKINYCYNDLKTTNNKDLRILGKLQHVHISEYYQMASSNKVMLLKQVVGVAAQVKLSTLFGQLSNL